MDNWLILFIVAVSSYLVGSFPTAYIFSRIFLKKDIRAEGSGNVGTLNFHRTSGKKILSIIVLLLDAAKGYLVVLGASYYISDWQLLIPILFVILGHNYPLWLGWKGGRGLATFAGIFVYLNIYFVLAWWVLFGISYLLLKKTSTSGMIALFLINIIIFIFATNLIFLYASAASIIVFLKYLPRLVEENSVQA